MKLSEILGWKRKDFLDSPDSPIQEYKGFNTALTSCDREIDREALAKELSTNGIITHASLRKADHIISTMPTWLKPTERK